MATGVPSKTAPPAGTEEKRHRYFDAPSITPIDPASITLIALNSHLFFNYERTQIHPTVASLSFERLQEACHAFLAFFRILMLRQDIALPEQW